MNISKKVFIPIFAVGLSVWFISIALRYMGFEFENVIVGYGFTLLYFTIPLLLIVLGAIYAKTKLGELMYWLIGVTIAVWLIFFLFWAMIYRDVIVKGVNPSGEPIHSINLPQGDIVVYRTNCGTTCSFGIKVNLEHRIVPGLKRTHSVFYAYPAADIELETIDSNSLKIKSLKGADERSQVYVGTFIRLD